MAGDSAERNLLFGVLAVQLDFITRDQLVAATSQWVLNKQRPLREVFVDLQALTADEAVLLDGVVQKHLERNGDDPRQSLQSIEAFDSVRATLGELHDDDVRSTVEFDTIGAAGDESAKDGPSGDTSHDTTGVPASRPKSAAPDEHSTQAGSPDVQAASQHRFTVLRMHQKGGLGRVSVALDEELNREIALKEILPTHADNEENRNRFVREAEITGALEHPGIVPVYSLGHFADGRPYYAMRFIHGVNMQRAIEDFFHANHSGGERQLAFRQLLARFIHVCNAMDYAHSRGVIHRDLKPSNVMIGEYGETLVVDWGLAKSLGEDLSQTSIDVPSSGAIHPSTAPVAPTKRAMSTSTQMGRIVGTAPYMSPEQAAGRLDSLGPRSDVYSLGATLYHVITGRVAFKGTEEEVIGNVQMGRFAKPREVRPDVPRSLEAICLKAMARLPKDRYASARELADDMERFMGDERVAAYREPVPARLWRWTRNHKASVAGAVGTLTVAVAALTAGVILLGNANVRERQLRDQVETNLLEAERQREAAETNFRLARESVRDYYLLVSEDTLLKQRGLEPLRDSLLDQALKYYQEFLEQREDDPTLRDEVASAHFVAGQISTTTGKFEEALGHFERAAEIQEPLAEGESAPVEAIAEYGRTVNAMGDAVIRQGQVEEAKELFEKAVTLRRRLTTAEPGNPEHAREVASSMMNVGVAEFNLGNIDQGIELFEQAQGLRIAHLGVDDATDVRLQRDLGMGYYNLGVTRSRIGEYDAAEQNLFNAADAFGKLIQSDPNDLANQRRLAACKRMLGDFRAAEEDAAGAVEFYREAVDLLTPLRIRHPFVPEYATDLAGVHMHMGEQQQALGQLSDALVSLEKAILRLRNLPEESAGLARHARDLGVALRTAAAVLVELGRPEEARLRLEESRDTLTALVRADTTDTDSLAALDRTMAAIGELEAPPEEEPSSAEKLSPAADSDE